VSVASHFFGIATLEVSGFRFQVSVVRKTADGRPRAHRHPKSERANLKPSLPSDFKGKAPAQLTRISESGSGRQQNRPYSGFSNVDSPGRRYRECDVARRAADGQREICAWEDGRRYDCSRAIAFDASSALSSAR
jgi:hypothetical protein